MFKLCGASMVFAIGAALVSCYDTKSPALTRASETAQSTSRGVLDSARRLLSNAGGRASLLDGRALERFESLDDQRVKAIVQPPNRALSQRRWSCRSARPDR